MIAKRRVNICQKTTTFNEILMLFHMHWIHGKTLANTISINASKKIGSYFCDFTDFTVSPKRKNKLTFNVIKEFYSNCK